MNDSEQRDILVGFLVGFLATAGVTCIPQLLFVFVGIELGSLMGGLILSVVIGGVGAVIAAGFYAIGVAMRTDSKHDRRIDYTPTHLSRRKLSRPNALRYHQRNLSGSSINKEEFSIFLLLR